ncbi:MAG: DUF3352 domain-containing protein [Bacteroidota bacterium]|nr:DUF3352 domain-containing protein [Bacteroidota bacterium]
MKKFFIWFTVIALLFGGGFWIYLKFIASSKSIDAMACIPSDAIYIIETSQPIKSWKKISESKPWNHIKTQGTFAEISKSADALDQMIKDHDILFSVFGDRKIFISAHKTKPNDYDFLYVVDLQDAAKIGMVKEAIDMLCELGGFTTKTREYNSYKISENLDPQTGEILYTCIVQNQLVCSYTGKLVEAAINIIEKPYFTLQEKFKDVSNRTGDGLMKLYLNAAFYDDLIACYQQPLDQINKDISNIIHYAGMAGTISDDEIKLDGNLNIHDSMDNYLTDMLQFGSGQLGNKEYITNQAAMCTSLGYGRFSDFYEKLDKTMQLNDKDYATVNSSVSATEQFLGITIRKNIISWIGDEVTYITLSPNDSVRNADYAIVIHANNKEAMQKNMDLIAKRLKRRSLGVLKVQREVYKDHTIKRMKVRGMFRKMFGKMFEKFDMPYYTIIEDRIVFTNTEYNMHRMIDDYDAENTLAKNEEYNKLIDQFNSNSNVFVYVNMEQYFPLMRNSVKPDTYYKLKQNKKYITCFPKMGFQLTGNGKYYDVKLRLSFNIDEPKMDTDTFTTIDSSNTVIKNDSSHTAFINNTKQEHYANGQLKMEAKMNEENKMHGEFKEYWENGKLKVKGNYENGFKMGVWKYYRESGEYDRKEKFE